VEILMEFRAIRHEARTGCAIKSETFDRMFKPRDGESREEGDDAVDKSDFEIQYHARMAFDERLRLCTR
jgi:hypothetical protein